MGKQNRELLKNIKLYEQKKKIKQSKSKVLGQKLVKRTTNKQKSISVWAERRKSIRDMVSNVVLDEETIDVMSNIGFSMWYNCN